MNKYQVAQKRKSIERLRAVIKERGGWFDESAYINSSKRISFRCKDGHEWKSDPYRIMFGTWCQKCFNKYEAGKHNKLKDGLLRAHNIATQRNGLCLETEYIRSTAYMRWRCGNGHEWQAPYSEIKRGRWCPTCGSGYRERLCRHYFEAATGYEFPKNRPLWLINNLGNRMELDGHAETINLAFEHHGRQHYKPVKHFNRRDETLIRRQIDDEKKRALCLVHGVT